ncbi:signal transduction histidine kinase [Pseudoduganella flava]|uniref:histidine kinase n=1 Tax=Pseudoduganella flava TaxID=871742 RepID=A0A562PZR2_9BURK|nr:ATP-binding protein [Pseudoduganella flava]QGZ38512.1 response regulator [Pseudoduganella flava]TWI49931.1 signal transduction histidine kinase [Pseudoduganella flava]
MLNDPIFQAAFHASPIGQYLLAPTDGLEILAANDAFLRSVGRQREDVTGRPLFDVFPNNPDDPQATGVQDLADSIRRAIDTGATQKMATQRYPIEMQRDGRCWFENMYWSATNTPIHAADGTLLCISHTTIDVTAQALAEQALRASRQEAVRNAQTAQAQRANLEAVLQVAPVGILVVDRDGKVVQRNPAHVELLGRALPRRQECVDFGGWTGWFADGAHAGRQLDAADWPLQRALAGHTVEHCLLRVQSFDSTDIRTMLVSSAPIHDRAGAMTGAVAVATDMEARVRAEQALQEADRRKDEFLAMLAHELRNPLAPIGTAAALLLRSHGDDEQVRRTSNVITRQVKHMSALVDELLDVARVTRGLIELDKTTLDVKRIVAEALEQARPAIEARGHSVQVRQPPRPAFVLGDHKRLVQVLANLLHNAAKFTPEGGLIQVELAIDPHHVRLVVSDSGYGMTPQLIGRAFELFAQGDRTLDRAQGGLGIGLALVKSLVALHGGSVNADSAGPGHGSRFTICLPKVEVQAQPAHHPLRDGHDVLAAGTPLTILAVDDNEDALAMLHLLLSAQGHHVVTTPDPREALRRADVAAPDACVLDIGLPDLDGYALARALRANPRTRHALLIALSGYGQDTDREKASAAGFDAYFVKPVDAEALSAALARARAA